MNKQTTISLEKEDYGKLEAIGKQLGLTIDQTTEYALLKFLKEKSPEHFEKALKTADPKVQWMLLPADKRFRVQFPHPEFEEFTALVKKLGYKSLADYPGSLSTCKEIQEPFGGTTFRIHFKPEARENLLKQIEKLG